MAMESGTKSVEEGVKLINSTGDALQEIIQVVAKTADLAKEISLSTEQQTRGNEQVSAAMSALSQVVKQTEISARETASAAHDLTELAEELKRLIQEIIITKK
jgi:methyl-accepting chemotaxis protein